MQNNVVGIITFHCSDNYGAMLQAYGLKEGLRKQSGDFGGYCSV